jgi:hypothetical protein
MKRHARRKNMMPMACAVALSVAAGLALSEEHASWEPGASPGRGIASADPFNQAASGTSGTAGKKTTKPSKESGADRIATGDGGQPKGERSKQGAGSRALTGNAACERAADQPPMATGVDHLNGPPVRFPAADTPE